MKINKILAVCLLISFTSSQAFFVEKSVHKLIEKYKAALVILEPHINDIMVTSHMGYDCVNNSHYTAYTYWCWSDIAQKTLDRYQDAESALSNKILINALGDGFLLGILVACCNKIFKGETLNKKLVLPTIAGALAMIFYQNHKLGVVPYFDVRLKKYENQFDNVSFYTLGRIMCALAAASVSYFGTDYAITKATSAIQDTQ